MVLRRLRQCRDLFLRIFFFFGSGLANFARCKLVLSFTVKSSGRSIKNFARLPTKIMGLRFFRGAFRPRSVFVTFFLTFFARRRRLLERALLVSAPCRDRSKRRTLCCLGRRRLAFICPFLFLVHIFLLFFFLFLLLFLFLFTTRAFRALLIFFHFFSGFARLRVLSSSFLRHAFFLDLSRLFQLLCTLIFLSIVTDFLYFFKFSFTVLNRRIVAIFLAPD